MGRIVDQARSWRQIPVSLSIPQTVSEGIRAKTIPRLATKIRQSPRPRLRKLASNLRDTQNPLTGGSIAGMSQPASKSSKPQTVTPVMNCKIRSKDGLWLWRFSVSKKGLPFQVTDWQGVVARPNQYVFTFEFIDVESSAWIGPYRLAQFLRRMLSERDKIQTEIVELS